MVWSRVLRGSALVAFAATCAAVVTLPAPPHVQPLEPCARHVPVDGVCTARVPLDRSGRVPGAIVLRVSITTGRRGTGTVLALGERPGDDKGAFDYERDLTPLRARRTALLDLRGSGRSRPLSCRALARERDRVTAVARCAEELGPARSSYTTAESAADVEAVRAALAVERLTLYGLGYGAKVALAYAAAHPEHVERLVLDSPEPPEGADPFGRARLAAIPQALRTGCGRVCRRFGADDPVAELVQLVRRAERSALYARVVDGHGRPRRIAIRPADLLGLLLDGNGTLFSNLADRVYLPGALHTAVRGDGALLGRLVTMRHDRWETAPHDALTLARTCADGPLPWAAGTPVADRAAAIDAALGAIPPAAFAPFGAALARRLGSAGVCRGWPDAPVAGPQSPLPAVPTLILAGGLDLRTPPAAAAALAQRIPGTQLLVDPRNAHDVLSITPPRGPSCAERALSAFVRGARVERCTRRGGIAWPWLPPRSLAAIDPPSRRFPLRVARTLRAVRFTLLDAIVRLQDLEFGAFVADEPSSPRDLLQVLGGLRAGTLRFDRHGIALRGYVYVPGVTLTGRFLNEHENRSFLRIGGRAAVHGRLHVRNCGESSCFVGRLGGHRVSVRVPGSA